MHISISWLYHITFLLHFITLRFCYILLHYSENITLHCTAMSLDRRLHWFCQNCNDNKLGRVDTSTSKWKDDDLRKHISGSEQAWLRLIRKRENFPRSWWHLEIAGDASLSNIVQDNYDEEDTFYLRRSSFFLGLFIFKMCKKSKSPPCHSKL